MDNINYLPFISFLVIATFSPGPNNITCASSGMIQGYRKTLRFIIGILSGFILLMNICGIFFGFIAEKVPFLTQYIRYIGIAYILYLAYLTLKSSYSYKVEEVSIGFYKGAFLQFVNPKAIIFGITIYSTFLANLAGNHFYILISSFFLATVTFFALSTYALGGAFINRVFGENRKVTVTVNVILSALLVFTAFSL